MFCFRGKCKVVHCNSIEAARTFKPAADTFYCILGYNPETKRLATTQGQIRVGSMYQVCNRVKGHDVRGHKWGDFILYLTENPVNFGSKQNQWHVGYSDNLVMITIITDASQRVFIFQLDSHKLSMTNIHQDKKTVYTILQLTE